MVSLVRGRRASHTNTSTTVERTPVIPYEPRWGSDVIIVSLYWHHMSGMASQIRSNSTVRSPASVTDGFPLQSGSHVGSVSMSRRYCNNTRLKWMPLLTALQQRSWTHCTILGKINEYLLGNSFRNVLFKWFKVFKKCYYNQVFDSNSKAVCYTYKVQIIFLERGSASFINVDFRPPIKWISGEIYRKCCMVRENMTFIGWKMKIHVCVRLKAKCWTQVFSLLQSISTLVTSICYCVCIQ